MGGPKCLGTKQEDGCGSRTSMHAIVYLCAAAIPSPLTPLSWMLFRRRPPFPAPAAAVAAALWCLPQRERRASLPCLALPGPLPFPPPPLFPLLAQCVFWAAPSAPPLHDFPLRPLQNTLTAYSSVNHLSFLLDAHLRQLTTKRQTAVLLSSPLTLPLFSSPWPYTLCLT